MTNCILIITGVDDEIQRGVACVCWYALSSLGVVLLHCLHKLLVKIRSLLDKQLGNIGAQWMVWFWNTHNANHSLQNLTSLCGWLPVFTVDNVQANLSAFLADVWVVDWRHKLNRGWLEGVLCRVSHFHFELGCVERCLSRKNHSSHCRRV